MNCVVAAFAASLSTGYSQSLNTVKFDGILSGSDNYSNTEVVGVFNGHKTEESVYGTFKNPKDETFIRYAVGQLK